MSSLFFNFHYSDGTVAFDPSADAIVLVKDLSIFDAPEVAVEGWYDLVDVTPEDFEMTPEDYATAGLPEDAFCPPFLQRTKAAIESVEDDALIALDPAELQAWATLWHNIISGIPKEDIDGMFPYSSYDDVEYAAMLIEELGETIEQAKCAQQHGVGMVLHITW